MGFVESIAELFTYHQSEKESNNEYSIMFNAMVESIKANGGQPWRHPKLADLHIKQIGKELAKKEPNPGNISSDRQDKIAEAAIEQGNKATDSEFLACQLILGADNKRYNEIKSVLANRFVFGNDDYPKDTTQALALLKNYKSEGGKNNKGHNTARRKLVLHWSYVVVTNNTPNFPNANCRTINTTNLTSSCRLHS